jgi:drug/metabolite transporter (DMT)-like permease
LTPFEIALVLGSALLHAGWSASIKGSGDPLCFNVLQLLAPTVVLACLAPLVSWQEVTASVWTILAVAVCVHALYFYWLSRALELGDLSVVYPIARSTPAFLPLVAVPLLGESISPGGGLGIAVVVVGVWLVHGIDRWNLGGLRAPAARFAFLTLAATVGYGLTDKAAMETLAAAPWTSPVPRSVVFCLLLSSGSGLAFAPLVLRVRGFAMLREAARTGLGTATLASIASFASYTLILFALQTAPVSYVVAVRQTSVLFAVLIAALVFGERPERARLIGAAATVLGVALIAWFS